jgi:exonuclease III
MNTLNIAKGAAATHQRRRARATTIPRHGNMGGTLPSAATQVWQDQGRVDEAVLAAEEKQPSPPAEGPGCNPGPMSQRWTFVSRRKSSKLDDIDSRSLIIWGVPYDISAATVHQELLGRNYLSSACVSLWRGTGTNRHVVLAFTSALCRAAVATAVSQKCKQFHWRSVDGRTWRTRQMQRHEAAPARPTRKGGRAGKYTFSVGNRFASLTCLHSRSGEGNASSEGRGGMDQERGREEGGGNDGGMHGGGGGGSDSGGSDGDSVARRQKGRSKAVEASRRLKHSWLSVLSLNVQGAIRRNIGELESYLLQHKVDIAAIQEAQLPKTTKVEAQGYKTFQHPGGDVLFFVAAHLLPFTVMEQPGEENQLWIRLKGTAGSKDLFLCSAHMPQESSHVGVREGAFNALDASTARYSTLGEVAVLGDLNARPGAPRSQKERSLLGKYGEPTPRTGNGELMVQFMLKHGMVSLIGQTPPPFRATGGTSYWYTRYDKPHDVKHAIDHALVSADIAALHPKFRVDYTHLESDHHALRISLPCPRQVKRMRCKKHRRTVFCLEKLIARSSQQEDVKAAESYRVNYARRLRDHFGGDEYDPQQVHDHANQGNNPKPCDCLNECVCAVVGQFISSHNKALEESVGTKVVCRGFSRAWYDGEVRDLVHRRREAYSAFAQSQGMRLEALLQPEDQVPQADTGEEANALGAHPRLA